jgi:hypothetical protein
VIRLIFVLAVAWTSAVLAWILSPREVTTVLNAANSIAAILLVLTAAGFVLFAVAGVRRAVPQLRRDAAAIWRYQRHGEAAMICGHSPGEYE